MFLHEGGRATTLPRAGLVRWREKDIKNDNAVQPSSIDALGGGRARRGGGPHGLAQQGEDSSVERQRYYSLTP